MEDILCKRTGLILGFPESYICSWGMRAGALGESSLLLFLANQHKQPEAEAAAWGPAPVGAHHAIASGYIDKYYF